ncbi:MAG: hypothetical protein EB167_02300 [Nitrososphaeria archaeon]|nr:hypothetical protein [Nitrososphaeria archaeon]
MIGIFKKIRKQFSILHQDLVTTLSLSNYTVGLGGCKVHKTLDCCEFDITIFDGLKKTEVKTIADGIIQIHHGKIDESDPDILQKYDSMQILSDPQWELRTFLAKIREKQEKLRLSVAKNCLVDAALFATRAKQNLNDQFAAVWIKCSAYLVCDGLVLLNSYPRSPVHMLESLRKSAKNKQNDSFGIISEILGLERATPSLLERMAKSTIGFSDMTENNNHGTIIQKKYEYLVANSLLSDCYFYLGYVNKNNIVSIRDTIHKNPDLIHVLKTAMDIEHDPTKLEQQATLLHKTANDLIHAQNHT